MPATYLATDPFISEEVKAVRKRIVVCCDGTWQSATSPDPSQGCCSNVPRLARVLANAGNDKDGNEWEQIVYYDAGIGTGELTPVDKDIQGGLGKGLIENILEAYCFIANNYCVGDELFFFGFSRGAYTVRCVAGLICEIGVLKPASIPEFIIHYNRYTTSKSKGPVGKFSDYAPWKAYIASIGEKEVAIADKVDIQVIGVWDTVGSLGVPDLGHFWTWHKADVRQYEFQDTNLNDQVLHAFQALALDERRQAFTPTVWKLAPNAKTKLCQCWFPGAHVNIGGGNSASAGNYPREDREQLSSVTFGWMLDRIRPHLAISESALAAQIADFKRLCDAPAAPESWPAAIMNKVKSLIWKPKKQSPFGYALGPIDVSYEGIYKLLSNPQDRKPNTKDPNNSKLPVSQQEITVEEVHPSVFYRQQKYKELGLDPYIPAAMRGWTRIAATSDIEEGMGRKGWKWVKCNDKKEIVNELWEFEIMNRPGSVEVRLIEASPVKDIWIETEKQRGV